MRTKTLSALFLVPFIVLTAAAQDIFLKLDSYFLPPNSRAVIKVLDGTFQGGAVTLGQVTEIGLHGPGFSGPAVEAIALLTDKKATTIEIQTLDSGTYLFGVSIVPKSVDRKAKDFNEYLLREELSDILAQRRTANELSKDVRVRSSSHVRAIFQVGNKLSDHYKQRLNHPVELIPQQNPYSLEVGQTISVQCIVDGKPVSNKLVTAGWESRDGKLHTLSARTAAGIAQFKLAGEGKWFVKTTQMRPLKDPNLNYEAKVATLTFEVRNKKG